ncbi:alanyl-tRNA synthetase [Leuconostoc mesenteroides]|uniref:alanyl-tRNA synthetase n=1 Tax=Leuconostoc mesenteroides TaxID=1245 RepID=UPI001CC16CDB|nr:alanyl-tRNA synthetase [Leuconostoc mesenteroides]MBZ1503533.1 alanyl-tRNA synthetase [Leuconostoc mesenteroides]
MDILTTRYERMNMSEKPKKFEKKDVLYLVITGLALVIIILLASWFIISNNSGATTEETGTMAKVSSSASSSSTSKYVEGKDYTVKYSNDGIVAKSSIDEALSYGGLNNFDDDIDKDNGNYAKFEFDFNKTKNVIVEKMYDNGYTNNEPTAIVAYDLSKKEMVTGHIGRLYYDNQPLVYTWTNNTVQ